MPRSYTLHCKRGSGTRWHKKSATCKTPCKVSHGAGHRRSPKSPYSCIKTGSGNKRSGAKKTSTKKSTERAKKMYSAGKIIAAMRKYSAKKKASSSSTLPHYTKISSGLKLPIGSKFTTDSGTYKRVSKTENSKGVVKL